MRSTEPSHTFWKTHRSLQAFDLLRALINSFFKVFSRVLGIASVHQSMIAKFMAVHQQRFKATLVASGELAHEHECCLCLRSQVDFNSWYVPCADLCPKNMVQWCSGIMWTIHKVHNRGRYTTNPKTMHWFLGKDPLKIKLYQHRPQIAKTIPPTMAHYNGTLQWHHSLCPHHSTLPWHRAMAPSNGTTSTPQSWSSPSLQQR